MESCISAIGTANPPYRIPQETLYQFMVRASGLNKKNAVMLKKLYDGSGIAFRYSVVPDFLAGESTQNTFFNELLSAGAFPDTKQRLKLYQATAADVAVKAVRECLKDCDSTITTSITHLITVSCTGMYAPGLDIDLIEKLGLNSNIHRICINFMGCYGSVNALKMADHICLSDHNARVLVVSVELCTIHFQNTNTLDNWIANSLFSDGAAAVLVEHVSKRTVKTQSLLFKTFRSDIIWEAKDAMGWLIGNFGFEMKLNSKVTKAIKKNIEFLTARLLRQADLTFEQIDLFAIHPGGNGILKAVEEVLHINHEDNRNSYETLKYYGNMSSATILFVLEKILKTDVEAGKKILSFAFGPGLSFEGMILETLS